MAEEGSLTDRARRVMTLAQEEADRLKHNYVGTEHLLLGLIKVEEGVAPIVLENLGVELHKIRSAVEFIIGRGESKEAGAGLTPRATKVVELAVDEARRLEDEKVDTEHLLLGVVREGEGIAASVLESLGVSLERVRAEVQKSIYARVKLKVSLMTVSELRTRVRKATEASFRALAELGVPESSSTRLRFGVVIRRWEALIGMLVLDPVEREEHLEIASAEITATMVQCFRDLGVTPGSDSVDCLWLDKACREIWLPLLMQLADITPERLGRYQASWAKLFTPDQPVA